MDTNLRERRRNRSWPDALKREIVAATHEVGASVAAVARRYEVNANQVFAWRKRFGAPGAEATAPGLVPVVVTAGSPVARPSAVLDERIEIDLASGYRIRVGSGVHAATLRRIDCRGEARKGIHDGQDTDLAARSELVVDKVHHPNLVGPGGARPALTEFRLDPPLRAPGLPPLLKPRPTA